MITKCQPGGPNVLTRVLILSERRGQNERGKAEWEGGKQNGRREGGIGGGRRQNGRGKDEYVYQAES